MKRKLHVAWVKGLSVLMVLSIMLTSVPVAYASSDENKETASTADDAASTFTETDIAVAEAGEASDENLLKEEDIINSGEEGDIASEKDAAESDITDEVAENEDDTAETDLMMDISEEDAGNSNSSQNLIVNDGTLDGILGEGETERTLNNDWGQSYPIGTWGGANADSPAKIKNVDGNSVLVLEPSTGNFASFFADAYADGEKLPAGTYRLSMDIKTVGEFATDNFGFALDNGKYSDVRIYDNGWKNCTELENVWLHYEVTFDAAEDSIDSMRVWFNTMGISTLYVDNLSISSFTEETPEDPSEPADDPTTDDGETPESTDNLVFRNGTMDGVLAEGETERTLNSDWSQSYPIGTWGGADADSPAKIKNVDGNNVLVLEHSTGNFASFFADAYADGEKLPAGTYRLSMDLKTVGEFSTDNMGFELIGSKYRDVRIYDQGWKNCTDLEDGWLRYEFTFDAEEDSIDSIRVWFNTMGKSTLYVDNLSIRPYTEETPEDPTDPEDPKTDDEEKPETSDNLVFKEGTMDGILAEDESERTLNSDWGQSYPIATWGGKNGDSPAKIKNIDGNNVVVLEHSTGKFASFFADVYADGDKLPAGNYTLTMDLKPVGKFSTDNVGYGLVGSNTYKDIRIYDRGWKNCTNLGDGWKRYKFTVKVDENPVDSIRVWFNTMGKSVLYIDNLSLTPTTDAPDSIVSAVAAKANFISRAASVPLNKNLVFKDGTFDDILKGDETERTLNGDWTQSYPVATFGGNVNADSPAKVRNVDGNNVLVLEHSTGNFASFYADLWESGQWLPAGTYELSMDLKPVGDFTTDNVGFNLYNQYSDIRIYDEGWQDCTELEDGWLHYSREFKFEANSVDSIQMWFNTMGNSTLYVDNLSLCLISK